MLAEQVRKIVNTHPEYAPITPVIEKEILHHDVMSILINEGAMQSLTFIGGTSLRLCYNSSRLSEDLDFSGGHAFKPSHFDGLENVIRDYIQKKYEMQVWVSKPVDDMQGDTASWKISIVREPGRPDLPRQKLHIDVCAVPSFDIERRPLINHYGLVVPTEGLLIPVQSLREALADKLIALAYRARRIKPRDLWDIVWIKQRGVSLSSRLVNLKLEARDKDKEHFAQALRTQLEKLMRDEDVHEDFVNEISRFIPNPIKERTIDIPDYWPYLQSEVKSVAESFLENEGGRSSFDMSL